MAAGYKPLFQAFQEDHALLGKGFYELSTCLRGNDLHGARTVARRLDREAGAHIAFEEECFYPALAKQSHMETDRLLDEHGEGLTVIRTLLELDDTEEISTEMRNGLLADSQAMEDHIAECGGLFDAIAQMTDEQQQALYEELVAWREKKPSWIEYERSRPEVPAA